MERRKKIIKIISYISEINELIHRKHHEIACEYNLTLEQFQLLLQLNELCIGIKKDLKGPTISEIAESFNRAQNTMSEKVGRLEKKGLVLRIKDGKDRRISRVVITDKGKKLLEEIHCKASNEYINNFLRKMDETDLNNLLYGLKALLYNLNMNGGEAIDD